MQSTLGHVVVNTSSDHFGFYRDLLGFLGWTTYMDSEEMLGFGDSSGVSVWFMGHSKDVPNDYDGPGVNHIAIHVGSIADVDATVERLRQHGLSPLFETPRHRPEFAQDASRTYYQVMFEAPDRMLWEVVYLGPL